MRFGKTLTKGKDLFVRLLIWITKACMRPAQKFIKYSKDFVNFLADFLLDSAKSAAQKVILLWLIIISVIIVSVLSYAAFYKFYVPTAEIVKPAYLSFSVCSSGVGICSFPSANVSFWNEEGTLQEVLGSGQSYSVVVTLELPESPKNCDLGMFVVAVKMIDRHGAVTSSSERSTMLRYRPITTRIVHFLGWLPLYFFGFEDHKQSLTILMFTNLVDDYYQPSVGANVEIRSHGIEIYSCTLTLSAKFTGLKYFLYYWPLTSAMVAFYWNLIICAAIIGLTIYRRKSALKILASTLDLRAEAHSDSEEKKDGYEEGVEDHSDDQISVLNTRGTQTGDNECYESDDFDMPVVQEPADFILPEEESDMDMDYMTELRQRRIN